MSFAYVGIVALILVKTEEINLFCDHIVPIYCAMVLYLMVTTKRDSSDVLLPRSYEPKKKKNTSVESSEGPDDWKLKFDGTSYLSACH